MKVLSRRSGFSLIELLTVIAIIAILAAIIFPVMATVKERARRNQCMTNLHQIALGVQAFKEDNRKCPDVLGAEVVFSGSAPDPFENAKGKWLFAEYVKTIKLFHCPSSRITNSRDYMEYDIGRKDQNGDAVPVYVYAYDSYDAYVLPNAAGSGGENFNIFRQSDGEVEPHYLTRWAPQRADVTRFKGYPPAEYDAASAEQKAKWDDQDYERQLDFRNPPGDTVITWCSYHDKGGRGDRAIVVFFDGTADQIPIGEMRECMWRVRPKKD